MTHYNFFFGGGYAQRGYAQLRISCGIFFWLCLLLCTETIQAQTPNLLIQANSVNIDDYSRSLGTAVDASGNIYVTGYFFGTVRFGGITLSSAGENDIFLAKYDNTGILQWVKQVGGTKNEVSSGVVVSGSDVYITGSFDGTISFNTLAASGSDMITTMGLEDIFLAKYNSAGDFQWVKQAGGTGRDVARAVAVLGTEVYITGHFDETANFGSSSGSLTTQVTSAGGRDIFLAKYNSSGDCLWAKRAGGINSDLARGVAVSGYEVYITGNFSETANFNTSFTGEAGEITSMGPQDIFIAKYNSAGDFQWAKRAGGKGLNFGEGVAVSGSEVYITGSFLDTANFSTPFIAGINEIISEGNFDIFLAKYNSSGDFQWAKRAGGSSVDIAHSVEVAGSEVYITGYFRETANFNTPSAPSSLDLISAGDRDLFLAKYSNTGIFQWSKRAGGADFELPSDMVVLGSEVYITGDFSGTTIFNSPSDSNPISITTVGIAAFLVRYGLPTINTNATLTHFSVCKGTASSPQSFTVSGTNLTSGILITAPKGFEVSQVSGSGYGASTTLNPIGGSVVNTSIYVRLAATATGTPSGNISLSSSNATPKFVTVSGTVNTPPTVSSNSPLCVGSTLRLSVTGAGAGTTYSWGATSPFSSTFQNPTRSNATVAMSGTYSVTVSNACGSTLLTTSVVVSPNVAPSITSLRVNGNLPSAQTNTVAACTNAPVTLRVAATNAVTYSWRGPTGAGSGFISSLVSPVDMPIASPRQGQYTVTVRNGCQVFNQRVINLQLINCSNTRLASAEDAEAIDMEINAYPNPVSKTLTVEVRLREPAALRLNLVSSVGQESGTWQIEEVRDFHQTELNLTDLQGGVYLLEATAGRQRAVKRVVKIQYE